MKPRTDFKHRKNFLSNRNLSNFCWKFYKNYYLFVYFSFLFWQKIPFFALYQKIIKNNKIFRQYSQIESISWTNSRIQLIEIFILRRMCVTIFEKRNKKDKNYSKNEVWSGDVVPMMHELQASPSLKLSAGTCAI